MPARARLAGRSPSPAIPQFAPWRPLVQPRNLFVLRAEINYIRRVRIKLEPEYQVELVNDDKLLRKMIIRPRLQILYASLMIH